MVYEREGEKENEGRKRRGRRRRRRRRRKDWRRGEEGEKTPTRRERSHLEE